MLLLSCCVVVGTTLLSSLSCIVHQSDSQSGCMFVRSSTHRAIFRLSQHHLSSTGSHSLCSVSYFTDAVFFTHLPITSILFVHCILLWSL